MPRPDPDEGRRLALILATSHYSDRTLKELRAPGKDADRLAEVLRKSDVGGFEVNTLIDVRSEDLLRAIAEFCSDRSPPDLLLLYMSCHGLLDDRGRLYYATVNTERRLLAATAISAQWLNEQLEDCRARRQIVILDCCHSGAFVKGAKGESALALHDRFGGRGRVILTASRATEYSFEGTQILGEGISSTFTAAVVRGLRTGEADRNKDGLITVAELYEYVYDLVHAADVRQTPTLWTYGAEGDLIIARSPRVAIMEYAPLPADLRIVITSPSRPSGDRPVAVPGVITVRGTINSPLKAQEIWILTSAPGELNLYPQGSWPDRAGPATFDATGQRWFSPIVIVGKPDDKGSHFDIIVVLADRQASEAFWNYLRAGAQSNNFGGLFRLPPGAVVYDRVEVMRGE